VPLVSVVLPARNAAATIGQALESLRGQTFGDLEVIVVDDGSSDDTAAHVRALAASDRRVQLLESPARGLVPALNAGVAAATGPLIARMDADDVAHPDRLAAQVALLGERPELGVAACQVEARGIDGQPVTDGMARYVAWSNALVEPTEIANARFIESPLVHPTAVIRRALLAEAYREGPFAEDYDLWLRLLERGVPIGKVARPLLVWRDHPGRATREDPRYTPERMRALKVQHLLAGPLAKGRPVVFWGAGMEGKPLLRALRLAGVAAPFVVEMDPRKIGNVIHGAAVIGLDALDGVLARVPDALVLIAVGVPSARVDIRLALTERGLTEGGGFWFLC
jgi:glycosyltransferase involved in cell wall biosynthesis